MKTKIAALGVITIMMVIFWEQPFLIPLKVFVVFLHEMSHAIGALFTGGKVLALSVDLNESGYTHTTGGNFLAIAASGYLGSLLAGSLMLRTAITGQLSRLVSAFFAVGIIIFTLFVPEQLTMVVFLSGITWGIALLVSSLANRAVNLVLLFFLGGLTSFYSLYDLSDFFRGDIEKTDAGIIAYHYMSGGLSATVFAYLIAGFISIVSVWIFYRITHHALVSSGIGPEEVQEDLHDPIAEHQFTPEQHAFLQSVPPEVYFMVKEKQMTEQQNEES